VLSLYHRPFPKDNTNPIVLSYKIQILISLSSYVKKRKFHYIKYTGIFFLNLLLNITNPKL